MICCVFQIFSVKTIKEMRKFPNLREITDEFIMSDLILMVSATILFHICMETSKLVRKTRESVNYDAGKQPIECLLLLPPHGKLFINNKLAFGADILANLEELERLVRVENSNSIIDQLSKLSPFWISFHQLISMDKIKICRDVGIKLFNK